MLRGDATASWRQFAISEHNYASLPVAERLGVAPRDASLFMVADRRWKYVHAPGFRPMLFDLDADPEEFRDIGADPSCEGERQRLAGALARWGWRQSQRTTRSEAEIIAARGSSQRRGILIGVWDEAELPAELWCAAIWARTPAGRSPDPSRSAAMAKRRNGSRGGKPRAAGAGLMQPWRARTYPRISF